MFNVESFKEGLKYKIGTARRIIEISESQTVGKSDIYTMIDIKKRQHEIEVLQDILESINQMEEEV